MKTGKILVIAGLAVVGLSLVAFQKVKDLTAVFDKMKITPSGIRSLNISLWNIKFNLDVRLQNTTGTAFSATGYAIAKLKRLVISYNGDYLATANVNMESLDIPAFTAITIKDIPVSADTVNLITTALNTTNFDMNLLGISAVIEVLGTEYTIDN